jgi:hypothetical protein
LAADAAYRAQLHGLDRAWAALDALPSTRAGDDFARTTMEMVSVAAHSDLSQHTARTTAAGKRRRWWLAGAGVAAAALGFVVMRVLLSGGDAAILADLPVIRQAELLAHIPSVEFLRRLPSAAPLDAFRQDEAAIEDELLNAEWASAPARKDRREWLENLPPEKQAELLTQADRFRDLPTSQRNRMRGLQEEIRGADDAAQLQRNLLAYGQWLSRLTLGEREELKDHLSDVPVEGQMERLRRFVRRENQRASRELSPEDAETLRTEVLALVGEHKPRLLHEMRRRGRGDLARRLEEPRGAMMILGRELQNDDTAGIVRERIVNKLSPDARAHLDRLGPWGRRMQLWQWIRDSLKPDWGPGELERFFAQQLNSSERERLLDLPSGEMQAELERLYVASEFGLRGPAGPGGEMRNPRGPDRPDFRPEMGKRGRPGGPPPEFAPEPFDRGPEGPARFRRDLRDGRPPPPFGRPGPPPPQEQQEAI